MIIITITTSIIVIDVTASYVVDLIGTRTFIHTRYLHEDRDDEPLKSVASFAKSSGEVWRG